MSFSPHPRRLITGLLLLYFVAAVWMAFRLPAHATPNELLNFEYIQVMRQIRGLPNRGLVDSEVRYTEWHQPPVYFTFAALFGLAVPVPPSAVNPPPPIEVTANPHYLSTPRGNLNPVVHVTPSAVPLLYTSRVAAALLGMVGVAALYRAGRRVHGTWVALLMASLMAFQPSYLHLSGSVNNDMPLTAMVAIVMSCAVLLLHRLETQDRESELRNTAASAPGPRLTSLVLYFVLGLSAALAILTKANGVFVLAFLAVVLLGHLLRYRRLWATTGAAVAMAAGLLPLWAGWLWLNTVRMRDTLGLSGSLPVGRVLTLSPLDFGHVAPFLPAIWRSYWLDWSAGDVGYGPDWLYIFWLAALVVMLGGWARRRTTDDRRPTTDDKSPAVGVVASSSTSRLTPDSQEWSAVGRPPSLITPMIVLGFLGISYLYFAVKALTVKEAGWMVPEARWWLPGLPALAWLAAAGFGRWWSPTRRRAACLLVAAVPPVIAFGLLLVHLPTLYPQAARVTAPDSSLGLSLDGALELMAAEADPMTGGRPGDVVLTWRAAADIEDDYTISTQLLAPATDGWRKLAEHNSFPGQGMTPTRGWRAGEVYRDLLTLVPDGALNGPTEAMVQVAASTGDGAAGEPAIVASTVVRPAAPIVVAAPLAEPVRFGDAIQLIGAQIEQSTDGPVLTLWWEALATPPTDYTVFVHLFDATGAPAGQTDSPPNEGLSPTRLWQRGDIIRDTRPLPPGPATHARVGLYDPATGERLPATQGDRPLPDNAYPIPLNP